MQSGIEIKRSHMALLAHPRGAAPVRAMAMDGVTSVGTVNGVASAAELRSGSAPPARVVGSGAGASAVAPLPDAGLIK